MQAVKALLSKDDTPREIYVEASDHKTWWLGYRVRHPELVFRTPESLSTARLVCLAMGAALLMPYLYI